MKKKKDEFVYKRVLQRNGHCSATTTTHTWCLDYIVDGTVIYVYAEHGRCRCTAHPICIVFHLNVFLDALKMNSYTKRYCSVTAIAQQPRRLTRGVWIVSSMVP